MNVNEESNDSSTATRRELLTKAGGLGKYLAPAMVLVVASKSTASP